MDKTLSYDDLIELQRKEKKELVAKTQKMKHSVPKDDKKKKKEITAEITQLLSDLELKHEEQRKIFDAEHQTNTNEAEKLSSNDSDVNSLSNNAAEICEKLNGEEEVAVTSLTSGKLSKAQKRRNKKALQQKEREKAIAEQEIENLMGIRHIESSKINKKLSDRGLTLYEIPSDGNCLYQSIVHQLSTLKLQKTSVETLRQNTAEYLQMHKEEYLPFLSHPETGDILSEEEFKKYCDDIANTSSWGGHVEIKVLSCLCKKSIEVIQADGPSVLVGDENSEPKLVISFHRHAYGLGEHYNSVIPVH